MENSACCQYIGSYRRRRVLGNGWNSGSIGLLPKQIVPRWFAEKTTYKWEVLSRYVWAILISHSFTINNMGSHWRRVFTETPKRWRALRERGKIQLDTTSRAVQLKPRNPPYTHVRTKSWNSFFDNCMGSICKQKQFGYIDGLYRYLLRNVWKHAVFPKPWFSLLVGCYGKML